MIVKITKKDNIKYYYLLTYLIKFNKVVKNCYIYIDNINMFKKYYKKFNDCIFFIDKNIRFGINDIFYDVEEYNKDNKVYMFNNCIKNKIIKKIINDQIIKNI